MTNYSKLMRHSDVAGSGRYADLSQLPTIPTHLTDLDTTVTGAQLNALQASVNTVLAINSLIAPLSYTNGNYYLCNSPGNPVAAASLGNSTLRVSAFQVATTATITALGIDIVSLGTDAGATYRLGVYADNGSGRPGALILDAGTINVGSGGATGSVFITLGSNLVLTPTLYWVGGALQGSPGTQASIRGVGTADFAPCGPLGTTAPASGVVSRGYAQTSVAGALPTPFNTTAGVSSSTARILYKVA